MMFGRNKENTKLADTIERLARDNEILRAENAELRATMEDMKPRGERGLEQWGKVGGGIRPPAPPPLTNAPINVEWCRILGRIPAMRVTFWLTERDWDELQDTDAWREVARFLAEPRIAQERCDNQ